MRGILVTDESDSKPKKSELQGHVAEAAIGLGTDIPDSDWPVLIYQWRDGLGNYRYFKAEHAAPKIVEEFSPKDLPGILHRAVHRLTYEPAYARYRTFSTNDAREASGIALGRLEANRNRRRIQGEILPFRFKGEDGFARLELPYHVSLTTEGNRWDECPTWAKVLCTEQNREAAVAYFGAFFLRARENQQALYVHSGGRSGKGSMISALKQTFSGRVVGDFVASNARFVGSFLAGKSAVFVDESDGAFTTSDFFKRVTGEHNWIEAEAKNAKDPITIDANIRFFIFSNQEPDVSSGSADKRRLIPYFLPEGDPNRQDVSIIPGLVAEMPAFVATACHAYREIARGAQIPVDWNGLDIHGSEGELIDTLTPFFRDRGIRPVIAKAHDRVEDEAHARGIGYKVWLTREELHNEFLAYGERHPWVLRNRGYRRMLDYLKRCFGVKEYRPRLGDSSDRPKLMRGVAWVTHARECRVVQAETGLSVVPISEPENCQ